LFTIMLSHYTPVHSATADPFQMSGLPCYGRHTGRFIQRTCSIKFS